jgi:hypothetical protein
VAAEPLREFESAADGPLHAYNLLSRIVHAAATLDVQPSELRRALRALRGPSIEGRRSAPITEPQCVS